ncbi:hypothetical protein BH23GEM6_BH23GEM6_01860 [soil metagenome]
MKPPILLAVMIALGSTGNVVAADIHDEAHFAAPSEPAPAELQRLRQLYFAAVQSADALEVAEREIRAMRAEDAGAPTWELLVAAYGGALQTLRAKHGRWPPARLRDLQEGLRTLDDVVEKYPDHAEARYLRLMSCYYLPGFLGRTSSVREDFHALGRLLPAARSSFSRDLYVAAAGFVLENGDLHPSDRARLERSLAL